MGSVVRVGAATKALHFLRAHSGVLPKALMDKGVQGSGLWAPGSGLRRQDTDHRVGKPYLWPLRVKAWQDLGRSPSLTPSVLRESLLLCLQPLQGHCGWALPSGSSQLYCPHIRDGETEAHDPPKVTER